jgi:hypothetical protein
LSEPALVNCLEFQRTLQNRPWTAGEYTIKYTDNTHLDPTTWKSLAKIRLSQTHIHANATAEDETPFYEIEVLLVDHEAAEQKFIGDVISQSLCRLGMLMPSISMREMKDIIELNTRDAIILIPDTNVLCNGSMSWLIKVLSKTQIWSML